MTSPYLYWGKAKPAQEGNASWHLLPYHCLDVAASGVAYLKQASAFKDLLCQRLLLTPDQLYSWMGFWLALHDLGKFSSTFQGQRNDILAHLQGRESRFGYTIRHDSLGQVIWQEHLEHEAGEKSWFGPDTLALRPALDPWVRAMTGHHGQPPSEAEISAWPHFERPSDFRAVTAFVDEMHGLFLSKLDWQSPCFADADQFEHASRELSWWLAGLAVLADWVGSNQEHFLLTPTEN